LRKGFHLVLVDQDGGKLETLREELATGEQKILTQEFDFKRNAEWTQYEELCKRIQEEVGGPENISVLINNVEERDPTGKKFHKATDSQIVETINANTFPLVFMSRFLGPDLKKRIESTQKSSAIINMTSSYSDWPTHNLPIFSSTKSFSDVVSQNLYFEN